jgi:hypothetical protein
MLYMANHDVLSEVQDIGDHLVVVHNVIACSFFYSSVTNFLASFMLNIDEHIIQDLNLKHELILTLKKKKRLKSVLLDKAAYNLYWPHV